MATITIEFEDDLLLRLKEYAYQHQLTIEEVIIQAVSEFLANETASEETSA